MFNIVFNVQITLGFVCMVFKLLFEGIKVACAH